MSTRSKSNAADAEPGTGSAYVAVTHLYDNDNNRLVDRGKTCEIIPDKLLPGLLKANFIARKGTKKAIEMEAADG